VCRAGSHRTSTEALRFSSRIASCKKELPVRSSLAEDL
jgi:hypothetical protein